MSFTDATPRNWSATAFLIDCQDQPIHVSNPETHGTNVISYAALKADDEFGVAYSIWCPRDAIATIDLLVDGVYRFSQKLLNPRKRIFCRPDLYRIDGVIHHVLACFKNGLYLSTMVVRDGVPGTQERNFFVDPASAIGSIQLQIGLDKADYTSELRFARAHLTDQTPSTWPYYEDTEFPVSQRIGFIKYKPLEGTDAQDALDMVCKPRPVPWATFEFRYRTADTLALLSLHAPRSDLARIMGNSSPTTPLDYGDNTENIEIIQAAGKADLLKHRIGVKQRKIIDAERDVLSMRRQMVELQDAKVTAEGHEHGLAEQSNEVACRETEAEKIAAKASLEEVRKTLGTALQKLQAVKAKEVQDGRAKAELTRKRWAITQNLEELDVARQRLQDEELEIEKRAEAWRGFDRDAAA